MDDMEAFRSVPQRERRGAEGGYRYNDTPEGGSGPGGEFLSDELQSIRHDSKVDDWNAPFDCRLTPSLCMDAMKAISAITGCMDAMDEGQADMELIQWMLDRLEIYVTNLKQTLDTSRKPGG